VPPKSGTRDWLRNVARSNAKMKRDGINISGFPVFFSVWRCPSKIAAPAPWDPGSETEAVYDARIRAYKVRVRKAVESQGWRRTDEKRAPEHVEWLALYQVGRRSLEQIVKQFDPHETRHPALDVNTVRMALRSTAALVGVVLRPLPRGRRPKIRK
jgi:hypothetical protein